MMTDHELVDALKRCEEDLGVVLEELRARGAPDDATAAQELDDASSTPFSRTVELSLLLPA